MNYPEGVIWEHRQLRRRPYWLLSLVKSGDSVWTLNKKPLPWLFAGKPYHKDDGLGYMLRAGAYAIILVVTAYDSKGQGDE